MATAVTVLCALMALALALNAYTAFSLGGAFGWGDGSVCVVDEQQRSGVPDPSVQLFDTKPGIEVSSVPEYCDTSPGGRERLLSTLTELPSSALYIGALFLLNWLLRAAVREAGPYTTLTARRMRLLGRYLVAGSLIAYIVESTAGFFLLASLLPEDRPLLFQTDNIPLFAILTGIGLISFARIMHIGAAMREDLEGVV
ncbi:hypothetical protein [Streptomyces sp. NPDC018693]